MNQQVLADISDPAFLQLILNSIPLLCVYIDRDYRYRFVNSTWEKWFQVGGAECIGKKALEIVGESAFQALKPLVDQAFGGETVEFRKEIAYKGVGTRYVESIYLPDLDETGHARGVLIMVRDLTSERENQEVVERKKREFARILDAIPGLIGHWDCDLRNLHANRAYQEYFGLSPEELRGKHMSEVLGPELYQKNLPLLKKALAGEIQIFEREIPLVNSPNSRYTLAYYIPEIERGRVVGLFVVVNDITELAQTKKRLEILIQNSPGMIYQLRIEKSGRLSFPFLSPSAFDIYEASESELTANPSLIFDLVEEEQSSLVEMIRRSTEINTKFVWQGKIRTLKGNCKFIEMTGVPKQEDDGSILYDGIVLDVTEVRNLQSELEIERVKLQQQDKLAALGEMAAGIAHEINNPLAVLVATVEVMKRRQEDHTKTASRLDMMARATSRIEKIVNGLRTFSREGSHDPMTLTNLSLLIEDTLSFCGDSLQRKGVSVNVFGDSGISVLARPSQISQVILNLIQNSADAIEESKEKWIEIAYSKVGSKIILSVTDSGPGIPPEVAKKMMTAFFTTKPVGKGTGLGLSIASGIVKEHHGRFYYDGSSARTRFVLEFPDPAMEESSTDAA